MRPEIATIIVCTGIIALFALNRDPFVRTSKALWIPVVWMSIGASRMLSQWLAVMGWTYSSTPIDPANRILDGSPLDRFFLTGVLVLGVAVLAGRARKVGTLLRSNGSILLFLLYCGVSTLWSDYPDVAFKRWVKALGDLTMVLIVITDANPSVAIRRFLTRVGFVLLPVSLLLSKYYPAIGRGWSEWGGGTYVGVATSKNELGGICLLFGVASLWCFLEAYRDKGGARRTRRLLAHGMVLAVVMWLFKMSSMMTALSCFLMAGGLIVATAARMLQRRIWLVHTLVGAVVFVSFFALFLDVGSSLVAAIGRDPTLTGRTEIWKQVMAVSPPPNSVLGSGFESFWLGPRLEKIWSVYWWHPNEAHNGYIEVFLDLGWMGLSLLALLILTGYRKIIAAFRRRPNEGRLKLAYFVTAVIYNFTESAVRIMSPIWICFLLAIIVAPEAPVQEARPALQTCDGDVTKLFPYQHASSGALSS